jgi:integrase
MTDAKLPYTYFSSKRLATGKWRDYWRFRRDGIDTPLPGGPGNPEFHAKYAELMRSAARRVELVGHPPERHSFAWLCESYLASVEYAGLSPRTQDDYRATINQRLLPILGPERFDCLARSHIKSIRDNTAKTHSARTAHKVKQMASCIYSWAEEESLLPDNFVNPAMGMRKLKGKAKPIEIWSSEEIALFLAKCEPELRAPVLLALYTGQRREDLVNMKWSDYLGKMVRVRQNKTGEPLTIPCHPELAKALKPMRGISGQILRNKDGKPMNAGQLSSAMNRSVAKIDGMPQRSLHGLRYAAAGALESCGCSVVEISSIVGHRTYQMAIKYARQRKDAEAAMARLERA